MSTIDTLLSDKERLVLKAYSNPRRDFNRASRLSIQYALGMALFVYLAIYDDALSSRDRIPLRKTDLARDQRRRRAGQGLHPAVRRRRAARAAPAAGRRSGLSRRHRPRRGRADSRQDAGAADRRLRLHRARDGFSGHDQQRLRALHAPRARHHQVARLPRLQEDHPAQRPRLEHAEPRPGRPPHEPGDRRRVRGGRLVEPADGGQGVSCRAGGRASSPAAAPTPASWRRRSICISTATTCART